MDSTLLCIIVVVLIVAFFLLNGRREGFDDQHASVGGTAGVPGYEVIFPLTDTNALLVNFYNGSPQIIVASDVENTHPPQQICPGMTNYVFTYPHEWKNGLPITTGSYSGYAVTVPKGGTGPGTTAAVVTNMSIGKQLWGSNNGPFVWPSPTTPPFDFYTSRNCGVNNQCGPVILKCDQDPNCYGSLTCLNGLQCLAGYDQFHFACSDATYPICWDDWKKVKCSW